MRAIARDCNVERAYPDDERPSVPYHPSPSQRMKAVDPPPEPVLTVPPSELPKPNFAVPTMPEKPKLSSAGSYWWEWPIIFVVVIGVVALIVMGAMSYISFE